MIFYLTTQGHAYTIGSYLADWCANDRSLIFPINYTDLFNNQQFPYGTYLFADLERLPPPMANLAAQLWRHLEQHAPDQMRCLNHPTAAMRRYEMLRNLYESGFNDFNVYRLTEARMPQRYPVFIRGENDHGGDRSGLLHNEVELRDKLRAIDQQGLSREEFIITEFAATADPDGIVRKYSAFYIAGRVIPRHVFFSREWMIKKLDLRDAAQLDEEWAYVCDNPHQADIERIFKLACIDYGRIDYALKEDRLQVWEINTNPMIAIAADKTFAPRLRLQERFVSAFNEAMRALDTAYPNATLRQAPSPN